MDGNREPRYRLKQQLGFVAPMVFLVIIGIVFHVAGFAKFEGTITQSVGAYNYIRTEVH
jgi:uncharacterized membrane protein YphA (DoxX/SURF4 family)